jgi:hypothetical protein
VSNGTHVNLGQQEVSENSIALQCSGGLQTLAPVVDYPSEKPCACNIQFFVLLIYIVKRPELQFAGKSTAV